MNRSIVLVAPNVKGGVLDHVKLLAAELKRSSPTQDVWVMLPSGRSFERLAGTIPRNAIYVLHMSHYGYQKRGAPLWLLSWFRGMKRSGATVGCYFHELFAFGMPWNSSFWLSPVQRHITAELARLSCFWSTNRSASAVWLLEAAGAKPHAVLPVFSNVGELTNASSARRRKIVVFGGAVLRASTYRAAGADLYTFAYEWNAEIHDVGPNLRDEASINLAAANGVRLHGRLSAAAVSELLSDALFGLVDYPAAYLAKSGVFAAYCAHGVCPVVVSDAYPNTDGLYAGSQYFAWIRRNESNLREVEAIRFRAFDWYQPHNLSAHAQELLRQIDGATVSLSSRGQSMP